MSDICQSNYLNNIVYFRYQNILIKTNCISVTISQIEPQRVKSQK
jgi:hypothetical protein